MANFYTDNNVMEDINNINTSNDTPKENYILMQSKEPPLKAQKAEEMKNAVRCRNCKFFVTRTNVFNFYYCGVRTWGKYNRHYSVKPHTKGCDKFERKEIEI